MRQITRHVWLLVIMVLVAMPSLADEAGVALQPLAGYPGEFLMLQAGEAGSTITLQSRLRLGDSNAVAALEGIWLAGLSGVSDAPPTLLSLVWTQDTSGWFPTWALQLQSDGGLFPDSLPSKRGQDFLEGSSYINLGSVTPEPGHVIEARLSYDPVSGRLDVGVMDLTTRKCIAARQFVLEPYTGPTIPALGIVGDGHGVQVEQFLASAYRVPFGLPWELMMKEEDDFERLVLTRFTSGRDIALWVAPNAENLRGQFALVADDGTNSTTVLELPAQARSEATFIPFAASELPLGAADVSLNYVDEEGRTWPLDTRQLHIVAANLNVDFGALSIQGDRLQGMVTVTSQDETVSDLPLRVFATFARPGSEELEAEPQLIFEGCLERISTRPTVIPLSIPIVTRESVLRLTLEAQFGIEVGNIMAGNEYYVLQ